jgi:hypothetical protein
MVKSNFDEADPALASVSSLYEFDITTVFGKEYVGMFNDLARFLVIQIGIQTMLYTMDSDKFSILSADFFMLLLFITIGVLFYWLVFKKVITFK